MAVTLEARRLTDAHRIAQVELALQAVAASRVIWDQYDPVAARGEWLALQVTLLRHFDQRGAGLAAGYLDRFRAAEGFPGGPLLGVVDFNTQWAYAAMEMFGPTVIKSKVADGLPFPQAKADAWGQFSGAVERQALQGSRRVVDQSALANPQSLGWRRVTDADPCDFCSMLAGRGSVYRSEAAAGAGRRFHFKCGCSVEEAFA